MSLRSAGWRWIYRVRQKVPAEAGDGGEKKAKQHIITSLTGPTRGKRVNKGKCGRAERAKKKVYVILHEYRLSVSG